LKDGQRDLEPAYRGGMKYMSERLVVKNFLCLKDIDIEVKDFLILIGPQAAGKSLCAKLLYFFRTIIEEIVRYHMMNTFNSVLGKPGSIDIYFSGKFESFFPKTYWDGQEFYIEYKLGKDAIYSITKKKHGKLEFYLDKNILESPQETIRLLAEHIKTNDNLKKINKNLNRLLSNRHIKPKSAMDIFIPAGRSFFSLLQKNIFKFLQTSNSVDPFLLEFGIFYEEIKQTGHDIPAEAQELIHSILKGDYVYAENLLLTGGRKITLELLSSGQQEALPLTLVLAYIISQRLESYDFTNIYVEEPEAHLFPDAQEQMSRLISFLQYNAGHKVKFVITTHSPYMLAAFNNLIKAGNIVKQNPRLKDAVCKEIPESMHIDIERFSAYSLKNGRAVSIIDEGNHLINADAIDSVSESIMEIFNTLLDIEFEGGEAGENV
jgi:ABC-type cobalamin/Fe3+-siderophores transport system ATPase subunit